MTHPIIRLMIKYKVLSVNMLTAISFTPLMYIQRRNPEWNSAITNGAQPVNEQEDAFMRQRFELNGFELSKETKIYKAPYKRFGDVSLLHLGSPDRVILCLPDQYFFPSETTFEVAYSSVTNGSVKRFPLLKQSLGFANQNADFQTRRSNFLNIDQIFVESYDEMDARIRQLAYKLKVDKEKKIAQTMLIWLLGSAASHQVADIFFPQYWVLMFMPPLACGLGMLMKGKKVDQDCLDQCFKNPNDMATLIHLGKAEMVYNQARKPYLGFWRALGIASNGDDRFGKLSGYSTLARTIALEGMLSVELKKRGVQHDPMDPSSSTPVL